MCRLLISALALTTFAGLASGQQSEWKDLFNGKDLQGWTQRGGKAKYSVENEIIVGSTVPNTPNSFLCTDEHYKNFVLELEFKVHPELNSGIQIRSNSLEDYHNGRVHGYQVEIDPSDRAWTAGIYDEGRRGWLFDLKKNDAARNAFKQNQWNQLRVEAVGDRIQTWLNGVKAADLVDDKTDKGFIALQVHGVGDRKDPITVRWRNLKLKQLEDDAVPSNLVAIQEEEETALPHKIVDEDVETKQLAEGFRFTEGPAQGPDGKIYFSDIPNQNINVFDPHSEQVTLYRENSGRSNGLIWTPSDALIACEGGNRRVTRQLPDGEIQVIADKFEGKKLNSPNDIALDNLGGIYFTDPRYGNREDMEMEIEGVYYLNRNRKISRVVDDIERPNGIVLSLDFATLYVSDTAASKIWKFQVAAPGKLSNKQSFANIGSDGMTIDHHGNVYATWDKKVHVFSPDGKPIQQINVPQAPANVTFGGDAGTTLFITARTGFYAVNTNVRGGRLAANPN